MGLRRDDHDGGSDGEDAAADPGQRVTPGQQSAEDLTAQQTAHLQPATTQSGGRGGGGGGRRKEGGRRTMNVEKSHPNRRAMPSGATLSRAGAHMKTKMYIAPSKKDCVTPSSAIFRSDQAQDGERSARVAISWFVE